VARHQHIVNPEVAVGRQRDTVMFVLNWVKGGGGFTNQRREDAGVAVRANGIASAQQQASASTRIRPSTFTSARKSRSPRFGQQG